MTRKQTILGQNPAMLWALWENVLSWFVRSFVPSLLPRLLPTIPEQDTQQRDPNDATTAENTRCIVIGRPGGMEQCRLIRLKRDVVTCGYNVLSGGPFVRLARGGTVDGSSSTDGATQRSLPPDAVVVRIRAFSVNYADCCIRWGLYESAKQYVGYPINPGFDVAGVVERVGSKVTTLAVGDSVFGASLFGAYSTRALVPAAQLRPIPRHLSSTQAAAIPAVALTALYALFLANHYPSDRKPLCQFNNRAILIHSAAGGVGSMLVQMSKILGLSPIVGVVGRENKVEAARQLGCHVVICKASCTNEEDMWKKIHEASPTGYSAVMESNGVSTLQRSYDCLCMTGRLISYGFHTNLPMGKDMLSPWEWLQMARKAARMPKLDVMEMGSQNKSVLAFNLSFFAQEREMLSSLFDQVVTWLNQGKLQCPRVTTFAMEQITDAHEFIQSGTSVGKIVMTTTEE